MARIPYIDDEHPELADQIAKIRGKRGGRLIKLYQLLLNSAPVADGWLSLGGALRYAGTLDGLSRELAIVRVAVLTSAEYEYVAHSRYALQEGATQAQLDALPQWRTSDQFDDKRRAVLAYTDAMTSDIRVPDEQFEAIRAHFDDRQIVELTVNIGFYNMVSRVLEALQVDPEIDPEDAPPPAR